MRKIGRRIGLMIKNIWLNSESEIFREIIKIIIIPIIKLGLIFLGRYKKVREDILTEISKNVSSDKFKKRKNTKKLFNDILFCRFIYLMKPAEYFIYKFDKLSHKGRSMYLTFRKRLNIYKKVNNYNYSDYFDYKTETYRKFKPFYGRDALSIYNDLSYEEFQKFVDKHPKFIYKPGSNYGGFGIKIYDSKDYKNMKNLYKEILDAGYGIIEELIIQDPEIAKIYPNSVNTVRVVSYRTIDNKVKILWTFLRIGVDGSIVDNMSSGGIAAMIDPETGIIYERAKNYKGDDFIFHPNTGVKLVGLQLPAWHDLLKLIEKMANVIPEFKLVGWDLAYTSKGWVLVEANAKPHAATAQISNFNGRLKQFEELEEIYEKEVELNG